MKILTSMLSVAILLALVAIASPGVAMAQGDPEAPTGVRVANGPNPGQADVSWNAVAGVSTYRVGWLAVEDYIANLANEAWRGKFAYSDVSARSSWRVERLTPGIDYYFIVGRRYENGDIGWSGWETLMLNADGAACPIMDATLTVGDTVRWTEADGDTVSLTINSVSSPETVRFTNSQGERYDRTAPNGRTWLFVFFTISNQKGEELNFQDGRDHAVSTDAGPGFSWSANDIRYDAGETRDGRLLYDIPSSATTATLAVIPLRLGATNNEPELFLINIPAPATAQANRTIVFGDLDWSSAQMQTRIAQYIVEMGYDYPTEVKFGSTLPLVQGLRRGDIQVLMEIWLPNQEEAWSAGLAAGEVVSLGRSLGNDWQSAFVIPAYVQQQYPGLDSVEDLKNPHYRQLFATAETGGKARLVSCVIGWSCENDNAAQVEGYGLSDHVHIINPGDRAALDADLYDAYERGQPWLGYQWGTNGPALLLDLVRLEEPAYTDECWRTTMACAYEDATVLIAASRNLPNDAPDVAEMLRKWDFSIDTVYREIVRWQDANPNADPEAAILWWLNNRTNIWEQWVTDEATASIRSALAAGDIPDGWPDN